ncbi:DUF6069 family protein [Actinoplanes sp. CA-142083]|uniref:DUF6069 family protein n=1 Tax=Actinoplanes sp. CA-142083 TaxID=3239903 RepID=UPI003D8A705E
MTNDMQQTSTNRIPARRTGRAVAVAGAVASALILWAVNDPWGGIDLAVRQGGAVRHVGPVAVAATALIAGLAAWGLLALLERTVRRPARTYRIITSILLALSLLGPLGSGIGTSSKLVLLAMHLTVGAILIIGLPGRRNR